MTITIGARVLKTGLAVAIALWLGRLVGLESPLLAGVAAIFTIQPSIYRSWVQVLDQLQGNVLGAVAAIAAVWLVGNTPITVGLVCILVIAVCIRLNMEDSTIGLALVTVIVLMESHDQGWMVALERLAALGTGIAAAFAVNVTIAPPRHRRRFVLRVQEAQTLLSQLLRTAVRQDMNEQVYRSERERLRDMLLKLEQSYRLFAEERVWRRRSRLRRARLLVVYRGMLAALEKGAALLQALERYHVPYSAGGRLNRRIAQEVERLCGCHEHLLWKWEGKTKPGASTALPREDTAARWVELLEGQAATGGEMVSRVRLMAVASSLFAYEDQLRRLETLMERWLKQDKGDAV
jgi:uncharacterized membrane protein YgaE (UPF0421/DUF939 family)